MRELRSRNLGRGYNHIYIIDWHFALKGSFVPSLHIASRDENGRIHAWSTHAAAGGATRMGSSARLGLLYCPAMPCPVRCRCTTGRLQQRRWRGLDRPAHGQWLQRYTGMMWVAALSVSVCYRWQAVAGCGCVLVGDCSRGVVWCCGAVVVSLWGDCGCVYGHHVRARSQD